MRTLITAKTAPRTARDASTCKWRIRTPWHPSSPGTVRCLEVEGVPNVSRIQRKDVPVSLPGGTPRGICREVIGSRCGESCLPVARRCGKAPHCVRRTSLCRTVLHRGYTRQPRLSHLPQASLIWSGCLLALQASTYGQWRLSRTQDISKPVKISGSR